LPEPGWFGVRSLRLGRGGQLRYRGPSGDLGSLVGYPAGATR